MGGGDVFLLANVLVQIEQERWVVTGYGSPLARMRVGWKPGGAVQLEIA